MNCRSLRNKYEKVSDNLVSKKLDVLALTETWLIESDYGVAKAALPPAYDLFSLPRADNTRGGGVAFVVRKSLRTTVVKRISHRYLELLEISIQVRQSVLHLVVIYRPPITELETDFLNEFSNYCEEFVVKTGKLIICGDFNFWVDSPHLKPGTARFLNLLGDYGLKNFVSTPTHIAGHVLDLVISLEDNESDSSVMNLQVDFLDDEDIDVHHKLDHALVEFRIPFPRPEKVEKTFSFRRYADLEIDGFDEFVGEAMLLPALSHFEVNQITISYRSSISSYMDTQCPLIKVTAKLHDDVPWYNGEIDRLRANRRKAEKEWLRLKTAESWRAF